MRGGLRGSCALPGPGSQRRAGARSGDTRGNLRAPTARGAAALRTLHTPSRDGSPLSVAFPCHPTASCPLRCHSSRGSRALPSPSTTPRSHRETRRGCNRSRVARRGRFPRTGTPAWTRLPPAEQIPPAAPAGPTAERSAGAAPSPAPAAEASAPRPPAAINPPARLPHSCWGRRHFPTACSARREATSAVTFAQAVWKPPRSESGRQYQRTSRLHH